MTTAVHEGETQRAGTGCEEAEFAALVSILAPRRRILVITGAGCSTASGIPDYRDRQGRWKRAEPMRYQAFTSSPAARARYWARSAVGWPRMAAARPNPGHHALAGLQRSGRLAALITQNVDGLHHRAGHRDVIDLHGRLDRVVCLSCHNSVDRDAWQSIMVSRNPNAACLSGEIAPDGDVDLDDTLTRGFQVPDCSDCGGIMKPDVVFFGENVPAGRVAAAYAAVESADAVLVAGSSLMVRSALRFVEHALQRGLPVCAVNIGKTRADDRLSMRLALPCEQALVRLDKALT